MEDLTKNLSGFDGSPLRPDELQWLREFRHEQEAIEKRRDKVRRKVKIYLSWMTGGGTLWIMAQQAGLVDWVAKLFVRGP